MPPPRAPPPTPGPAASVASRRSHVVDALLTLCCPLGGHAFVLFPGDQCCVSCAAPGCPSGLFCLWCGEAGFATEALAQAHLEATCPRNPTPPDEATGLRSFYLPSEGPLRDRRRRDVDAYLAAIPTSAEREATLEALRRDLEDLGVVPSPTRACCLCERAVPEPEWPSGVHCEGGEGDGGGGAGRAGHHLCAGCLDLAARDASHFSRLEELHKRRYRVGCPGCQDVIGGGFFPMADVLGRLGDEARAELLNAIQLARIVKDDKEVVEVDGVAVTAAGKVATAQPAQPPPPPPPPAPAAAAALAGGGGGAGPSRPAPAAALSALAPGEPRPCCSCGHAAPGCLGVCCPSGDHYTCRPCLDAQAHDPIEARKEATWGQLVCKACWREGGARRDGAAFADSAVAVLTQTVFEMHRGDKGDRLTPRLEQVLPGTLEFAFVEHVFFGPRPAGGAEPPCAWGPRMHSFMRRASIFRIDKVFNWELYASHMHAEKDIMLRRGGLTHMLLRGREVGDGGMLKNQRRCVKHDRLVFAFQQCPESEQREIPEIAVVNFFVFKIVNKLFGRRFVAHRNPHGWWVASSL